VLAQHGVGQPLAAQGLVDERLVEPLHRHRRGLGGRHGEAVGVLADGAQAAGALVRDDDRLRVPATGAVANVGAPSAAFVEIELKP